MRHKRSERISQDAMIVHAVVSIISVQVQHVIYVMIARAVGSIHSTVSIVAISVCCAYLYVFAGMDLVELPDEAQAAVHMLAEHILSS